MLAAQSSDGKFPSVAFSKRMTGQWKLQIDYGNYQNDLARNYFNMAWVRAQVNKS